jgi:hypothetical protein
MGKLSCGTHQCPYLLLLSIFDCVGQDELEENIIVLFSSSYNHNLLDR